MAAGRAMRAAAAPSQSPDRLPCVPLRLLLLEPLLLPVLVVSLGLSIRPMALSLLSLVVVMALTSTPPAAAAAASAAGACA